MPLSKMIAKVTPCPDLVTSLVFTIDGREQYILSGCDGHYEDTFTQLQKRLHAIHVMTELNVLPDGLFDCCIAGTDGSFYRLRFRRDDVLENINKAWSALSDAGVVGHFALTLFVPLVLT